MSIFSSQINSPTIGLKAIDVLAPVVVWLVPLVLHSLQQAPGFLALAPGIIDSHKLGLGGQVCCSARASHSSLWSLPMCLSQGAFEIRLSELEHRQVVFLELRGTSDLVLAGQIRLSILRFACMILVSVRDDSAPLNGVLVR